MSAQDDFTSDADLDFSWGDDPPVDSSRPTIPIEPIPENRWGLVAMGVVLAVALLVLIFVGGRAVGMSHGNGLAEVAEAQTREAQRIASIATTEAARWQACAEEASDTVVALMTHVESLEARITALEDAAAEASETIEALTQERDRLKALREQRERATAPLVAASGTGWQTARVSWYGPGFYGRKTASGAVLTQGMMNVAHRSLPFGTRIQFEYNGRTAIAVVNDRGPFIAGRTFDLGPGTATTLGFSGVGTVRWRVV